MKCIVCGDQLPPRKRKFCSEECEKNSRRKTTSLVGCLECGEELVGQQRQFCCKLHSTRYAHRRIANSKRTKEVEYLENCQECGEKLQKPRRRFCSRNHQLNWNSRVKYKNKHQLSSIMSSPRNYLMSLRSFYKRRDTLSIDFLADLYEKQNGLCAITGRTMTYIRGEGKVLTNISIDRIDSSKGYEPENVQLICYIVNVMKNEYSLDQLKDWARAIAG